MKINNLTTNTNFNGYKNLISYNIKSDGECFAYLGFQVDNNGVKDLDKWHEVLKHFDYDGDISPKDDTVIFTYARSYGYEPGVRLNSCVLADSELLNDDTIPENFKKASIKGYQFIANLTRRIMNDSLFDFEMANVKNVAVGLYEELFDIFKDGKQAMDLLTKGTLKLKKEQKTALCINKGVQKIMEKTFR